MEKYNYEKPKLRPYFYEENGQIKPYYYCSLCGIGPFKIEDFEDHKIIMRCDSRQKIYHCKSCNFILFPTGTAIETKPQSRPKQSKNHPFRRQFNVIDNDLL